MNREDRNGERYSHCLCLHVKPASLFIGIYFFITSVLKLIKLSSGYNIRSEDDMRRFVAVNRPTTTLLFMINLMVAIVSAILIYGVTKSKASYLMPFFGIQLYHFLFSLPSSLSQLNISTSQYRNHYGNSPVPSPSEVRTILRTDDNATYTLSVLATLIDFLCDIYFICIIWKCYRYLKMKEITSTLNLPYNLDLEIVVPSEVVSTTNVTPPDYETAIKDSPPPDYESAIKFQAYNSASDQGNVNLSSCSTTNNSSNNENHVYLSTDITQKLETDIHNLTNQINNNNYVNSDQSSEQPSQLLSGSPNTSINYNQPHQQTNQPSTQTSHQTNQTQLNQLQQHHHQQPPPSDLKY